MDIEWTIVAAVEQGDAVDLTAEYRADGELVDAETFAMAAIDAHDPRRLAAEMAGHVAVLRRRLEEPAAFPPAAKLVGARG